MKSKCTNEDIDVIEIPKDKTFNLPEGQYRGKLVNVQPHIRNTPKGPIKETRLLFEVDIPSLNGKKIPLAGRNFEPTLEQKSDLRTFLESWLGAEYFEENSGGTIQLSSLIDKEIDLSLMHIQGEGYDKPLVVILEAKPPGTLELTEKSFKEEKKDI